MVRTMMAVALATRPQHGLKCEEHPSTSILNYGARGSARIASSGSDPEIGEQEACPSFSSATGEWLPAPMWKACSHFMMAEDQCMVKACSGDSQNLQDGPDEAACAECAADGHDGGDLLRSIAASANRDAHEKTSEAKAEDWCHSLATSSGSVRLSPDLSEITEDLQLLLHGASSRLTAETDGRQEKAKDQGLDRPQASGRGLEPDRSGHSRSNCFPEASPSRKAKRKRRHVLADLPFKGDSMSACAVALLRIRSHRFGHMLSEGATDGLLRQRDCCARTAGRWPQHPLDLDVVQERLDCGHYEHSGQFADDVRRMFRSAIAYARWQQPQNKTREDHVMGLWRAFEEDVEAYCIASREVPGLAAAKGCKGLTRRRKVSDTCPVPCGIPCLGSHDLELEQSGVAEAARAKQQTDQSSPNDSPRGSSSSGGGLEGKSVWSSVLSSLTVNVGCENGESEEDSKAELFAEGTVEEAALSPCHHGCHWHDASRPEGHSIEATQEFVDGVSSIVVKTEGDLLEGSEMGSELGLPVACPHARRPRSRFLPKKRSVTWSPLEDVAAAAGNSVVMDLAGSGDESTPVIEDGATPLLVEAPCKGAKAEPKIGMVDKPTFLVQDGAAAVLTSEEAVQGSPEELEALEVLTGLLCSSEGGQDDRQVGSPGLEVASFPADASLTVGADVEAPAECKAGAPFVPLQCLALTPKEEPQGLEEDGTAASVLASLASGSADTDQEPPSGQACLDPSGLLEDELSVRKGCRRAYPSIAAAGVHKVKQQAGRGMETFQDDSWGPVAAQYVARCSNSSSGGNAGTDTQADSCLQGSTSSRGIGILKRRGTNQATQGVGRSCTADTMAAVLKDTSGSAHLSGATSCKLRAARTHQPGPAVKERRSAAVLTAGFGAQQHADETKRGEIESLAPAQPARTCAGWRRHGLKRDLASMEHGPPRRVGSHQAALGTEQDEASRDTADLIVSVVRRAEEASATKGSAARTRGYDWDRASRPRTRRIEALTDSVAAPCLPGLSPASQEPCPPPPLTRVDSLWACAKPEAMSSLASGSGTSAEQGSIPAGGCARTSLPFCWSSSRKRGMERAVSSFAPDSGAPWRTDVHAFERTSALVMDHSSLGAHGPPHGILPCPRLVLASVTGGCSRTRVPLVSFHSRFQVPGGLPVQLLSAPGAVTQGPEALLGSTLHPGQLQNLVGSQRPLPHAEGNLHDPLPQPSLPAPRSDGNSGARVSPHGPLSKAAKALPPVSRSSILPVARFCSPSSAPPAPSSATTFDPSSPLTLAGLLPTATVTRTAPTLHVLRPEVSGLTPHSNA